MKSFYVYIITNEWNTVLYTGVTSDLITRMNQHKSLSVEGFSKRYHLIKLVYYEECDGPTEAIMREKQIKAGSRLKKINLVEENNKLWRDLTGEWIM